MLGVRGSVDIGSEVAHPLQLLVHSVKRPHVDGVVTFVDDLGCHRRLSRGGEHRIRHISKLVQSGNCVNGGTWGSKGSARRNGKIVGDLLS